MLGRYILSLILMFTIMKYIKCHSFLTRSFLNKYNGRRSFSPFQSRRATHTRRFYKGATFIDDRNERNLRADDGPYIIPLEDFIFDITGMPGRATRGLPEIVRGVHHERYIGEHSRDPLLHDILRRFGFVYSGARAGYTDAGNAAAQKEVDAIFDSLRLGGTVPGTGDIFSPGVSSVQNPLPGRTAGIDDFDDDFLNGLLANSESTVTKQEQSPNLLQGIGQVMGGLIGQGANSNSDDLGVDEETVAALFQ